MLAWAARLKGAPSRSNNAAVTVGDNVFSFGGFDGKNTRTHPIDAHVFNTVSLRWTTLTPASTEAGEYPTEVPSMRYAHTAALIDNVIYIWGGRTSAMEFCNALYGFRVDSHAWFKPKVSGRLPQGRQSHSACVLGRVMYVYGGWTLQQTTCTNDVYALDSAAMAWSLVSAHGNPGPVPQGHSAAVVGTRMFVLGGQGVPFNNVRVFDTAGRRWLRTPPAPPLPPGRRACHGAFAHGGALYVFSGEAFRPTVKDLWRLHPDTLAWTKVVPRGRGRSWTNGMCCCAVGDRVVLFGGSAARGGDLHVLDLRPKLKTLCKLAVIRGGLERSELPHDVRWELAAMTTRRKRKARQELPMQIRPNTEGVDRTLRLVANGASQ